MLKLHKELPKARTPHVPAGGLRPTAYDLRPLTDVAPGRVQGTQYAPLTRE